MEEKTSIRNFRINRKTVVTRLVSILVIYLLVGIATYLIPQGMYERTVENGHDVILKDSFRFLESGPLPVWRWFTAPFEALVSGSSSTFVIIILMMLFMGGIMVILDESGIMLYIITSIYLKYGAKKYRMLWIMTAVMMLMGSTISFYDQCGILVPVALGLSFASGWDSMVGLGLSFFPIAMGFSVSTINPFTVGIPQSIAGLPVNSGIWLRLILLVVMYLLYVTFLSDYAKKVEADPSSSLVAETDIQVRQLFPDEADPEILNDRKTRRGAFIFLFFIALIFLYTFASIYVKALSGIAMPVMLVFLLAGSLLGGLATGKLSGRDLLQAMKSGVMITLPPAIVAFLIMGLRQIVMNGNIMDTLLYYTFNGIQGMSPYIAVFVILGITLALEFVVSSATAKAFLILPLLVPLGNMVGLTSQTIVQAYMFGDSFSNAFYPTSNMVMILSGIIGVSFNTWYKWSFKLILRIIALVVVTLIFCVAIGYGPF